MTTFSFITFESADLDERTVIVRSGDLSECKRLSDFSKARGWSITAIHQIDTETLAQAVEWLETVIYIARNPHGYFWTNRE
jgi:hypothetical protein